HVSAFRLWIVLSMPSYGAGQSLHVASGFSSVMASSLGGVIILHVPRSPVRVTIAEPHSKGNVGTVNSSDRERHWTQLMEQSLQGDSCAYQELLVLLTVAVRNAVRGRARSVGLDPEDVVQEVLLALHLKRNTWVKGTPVAPWVSAIARNKIVDALRRRGHRTEVPLESVMETLWSDDSESEGHAHDLERVLGKLNDRQREVVGAVS